MKSNYLKMKYNPTLSEGTHTPLYEELEAMRPIGIIDVNGGTLEWCILPDEYGRVDAYTHTVFTDTLIDWLSKYGYTLDPNNNLVDYRDVLRGIEISFITHLVNTHTDVPLLPYSVFKGMVDGYLAGFPDDFEWVYSTLDLGDVINEVGLAGVDKYSLGNMLTHFHDWSWVERCEHMTLLAYRNKLDISPMGIALTPWVAAQLK